MKNRKTLTVRPRRGNPEAFAAYAATLTPVTYVVVAAPPGYARATETFLEDPERRAATIAKAVRRALL